MVKKCNGSCLLIVLSPVAPPFQSSLRPVLVKPCKPVAPIFVSNERSKLSCMHERFRQAPMQAVEAKVEKASHKAAIPFLKLMIKPSKPVLQASVKARIAGLYPRAGSIRLVVSFRACGVVSK